MRTLRPQLLRQKDYEGVERQLLAIFLDVVFRPVMAVLQRVTAQKVGLANAGEDALIDALRTGRIQYADGIFSGSFNTKIVSALRALGAKPDRGAGTYRMAPALVPGDVRAAAAQYAQDARAAHEKLKATLDDAFAGLDITLAGRRVDARGAVDSVEDGWRESARGIEIAPELQEDSRDRLAEAYSDNMDLWIKKFSRGMIVDLRESVEENARQGYRFDRLAAQIRSRYSVSTNKARFLARQETSLFMAQFRRQRFGEAGVTRYTWRTSHDGRVRHDHKKLDGRVFYYEQPPVVDETTGRRANPGEDYQCRCVDIPILDPVAVGS
jgi:SPP1 gp7 family putative phage head morphogenesis protein